MVDGGFDPLHAGHVKYFEEAAGLGLPVLCNVSCDAYVATKHPVLLPERQRVALIDAIRWIAFVHLSRTTTAAVLEELRPRYYVKGGDWRDRLPAEEVDVCRRNDIEPVFLETVIESSSGLLARYRASESQSDTLIR